MRYRFLRSTAAVVCAGMIGFSPLQLQAQSEFAHPPIYTKNSIYSDRSLDELKVLIKDGDINAEMHYALRLMLGIGLDKDLLQARLIFEKYSAQDQAPAIQNLGLFYEYGLGIEADQKKAFELYQKAMELGDINATYELGHAYDEGLGIEPNLQLALKYYQEAAARWHPEALNNLGVHYAEVTPGNSKGRDEERAESYFRSAILHGSKRAYSNLAALMHRQDKHEEAYKLLEKGMEFSDPLAARFMGQLYLSGVITEDGQPDSTAAEKAFRIGSQLNDAPSMTQLASLIAANSDESHEQAMTLLMKASKMGEADASYMLYTLSSQGKSNEAALTQARQWLRRAASQGSADAMFELGLNHESGQTGFSINMKEAYNWWIKAARLGHTPAMNKLGLILIWGSTDIEKNPTEALRWFQAAASRNDFTAMRNLAYLYLSGDAGKKDPEKALSWLLKASELGDARSQLLLGDLYVKGEDIKRDLKKAAEFYALAAKAGLAPAMLALGAMNEYGRGMKINLTQAKAWYQKAEQAAEAQQDPVTIKRAQEALLGLEME